ncbi:DUF305 domain-containing protein [Mycobacterium sp. MYCO198283]|uniref:DUF305 domain-containing protein n=1 Tax=Mycobacterium sp. MYCO198283 TaxID=2883505 RepID=UPI001E4C5495|nr:DUF305 domain-containing protein [Mycobacterium sp. MYCO198283]MCG5431980.1 DUF305 domain-containing protein [Mycobacterium sp. MYCO198283]
MIRLSALLAAALGALLLIAGCSQQPAEHDHANHDHGSSATHNAQDVMFAQHMIPHHRQAVELSALVPERTQNAEVRRLAQQISDAQQPEIDTMTGWLTAWGETSGSGGHDAMAGMVDDATMQRLTDSRGTAFDRLWLQSMIAHHEGAVTMAQQEVDNGGNPDAKALARRIVETQRAEIDQMKKLLGP